MITGLKETKETANFFYLSIENIRKQDLRKLSAWLCPIMFADKTSNTARDQNQWGMQGSLLTSLTAFKIRKLKTIWIA